MKLKRVIAAGAAVIGLGVAAGPAHAAAGTFNGTCTFSGPTMTLAHGGSFFSPEQVSGKFAGSGTCTPTGGAASSAAFDVQVAGKTSCVAMMPAMTGSGTLTIGGTAYPVSAKVTMKLGYFWTVTLSGTSGAARGSSTTNLLDAAADPHGGLGCLTGQSTDAVLMPLTLSTGGPLVFG